MNKNENAHRMTRKNHAFVTPISKEDSTADEAAKRQRDRELKEMLSPFWAWRALYR